ncbi:small membrane A-kinase anchor protein-like [Salvelinus alpinus]|uniref:small membrane A-kinase anchor protein-like n=1 Tax=Salvelinus alpinus TaxID=8036 RepID=UPI0039FC63B5
MGCVKSKKSDPIQYANSGKTDGNPGKWQGENALLVHYETGSADDSARVDPILLEYAQRLSEEIVARAVQQWLEVDSRYIDIPYIECDVP